LRNHQMEWQIVNERSISLGFHVPLNKAIQYAQTSCSGRAKMKIEVGNYVRSVLQDI